MFSSYRKGDRVEGLYRDATFTGKVVSIYLSEWTKNVRIEVDFDAPVTMRGNDVRTGVIICGEESTINGTIYIGEVDWMRRSAL